MSAPMSPLVVIDLSGGVAQIDHNLPGEGTPTLIIYDTDKDNDLDTACRQVALMFEAAAALADRLDYDAAEDMVREAISYAQGRLR